MRHKIGPNGTKAHVRGGYGAALSITPFSPAPLSKSYNQGATRSSTFGNIHKDDKKQFSWPNRGSLYLKMLINNLRKSKYFKIKEPIELS